MYRITATKADGTTQIEIARDDVLKSALLTVLDRGYVKVQWSRHVMTREAGETRAIYSRLAR